MKKLLLMLTLILGIGLTTTSCSKQKQWDEMENITIDLYKNQGSLNVKVIYMDGSTEERILHPHQNLKLLRSQVNVVYVTALENGTVARLHGYLIYLNKGDKYEWNISKDKTDLELRLYSKWQDCITNADGSDLECEACDILYNKEGKFSY